MNEWVDSLALDFVLNSGYIGSFLKQLEIIFNMVRLYLYFFVLFSLSVPTYLTIYVEILHCIIVNNINAWSISLHCPFIV